MKTIPMQCRVYNQEVTVEVPVYGTCPLCQTGWVYECSGKALGCTNWKGTEKGCQLTIWKEYAGFRLQEGHIHELLAAGETSLIEGFRSKEGKPFSARLGFHEGKVRFEFDRPPSEEN